MPKPVTIRHSLVLSFALVIVVLTLVLLGITWLSARSASTEQAERLVERTLADVDRSLRSYFQPIERILTFATAWREKAVFDSDADLEAVFDTIVEAAPQVSDVRIESYGVFGEKDFEDDAVRWSPPRPLGGGVGQGMTAYSPIELPSGRRALVAVDIPLEAISKFTMELRVTPHTKVLSLIRLDDVGGQAEYGVIGLPADERFEDAAARRAAMLKRGRDLGLPYLEDAIRAFGARGRAKRDKPLRYESGGKTWWMGFRSYDLDGAIQMADVVCVPEEDLLGDRARFRWSILIAAAIALLLAVLLALLFARRAGEPIEALVAETERMERGDFSPGAPIETRLLEVRRLAAAHEKMRLSLEHLLRLEHALDVARVIQQGTFPSQMPTLPGYEIHGGSVPAELTGGDTFDVIGVAQATDGGHHGLTQGAADLAVLLLADATGHGVGPALSVTQVRAMLRMATRLGTDVGTFVSQINQQLCDDLPAGRFISAWIGVLDPQRNHVTAFSAGQGPIYVYRAQDGSFERSGGDAPPLGLMEIDVVLPEPTKLAIGDLYIVLSDGFHEALGPDGSMYGEERVQALIRAHAGDTPEAILNALHAAVDAFTEGAPPDDDRTCVIVKRTS